MSEEKFIHPLDLDTNVSVGINIPINADSRYFFSTNYTTLDQAKSNLRNLLLTNKKERIMIPNYGIDWPLFDNNNKIQTNLRADIQAAIELWTPYIQVQEIIVRVNPNRENEIGVSIQFYINNNEELETLDVLKII